MRVQVTKTMVNALNKALKARTFTNILKFEYDTLSLHEYQIFVSDNIWQAYDNGDYNANEGTFKFIRIIYKEECFSVDRFLTTYELIKCFKTCSRDYNTFINNVFDACEI